MVSTVALPQLESTIPPPQSCQKKFIQKLPIVIGKITVVAITVGLLAAAAYATFSHVGSMPSADRYSSSLEKGGFAGIGLGLTICAVALPLKHLEMFKYTESNLEDCKKFLRTALKIIPLAIGNLFVVGYALYALYSHIIQNCCGCPPLG